MRVTMTHCLGVDVDVVSTVDNIITVCEDRAGVRGIALILVSPAKPAPKYKH